MNEYLSIFKNIECEKIIKKYLETETLNRIKYVGQFCGCDYTKLYSPLFFYSRFYHSLIVAYMTYHFTLDKKETIAALLHDVGTPCFSHTIDYVMGDYVNQESSEKSIIDIIKKDKDLLNCLKSDHINLEELNNFNNFPILENKSPKLCTDRLDGVLHTAYVWLHKYSLKDIKKVYNNITVLIGENGIKELGFMDEDICLKFVDMVYLYAKELQSNTDKYIMKYVSEIVKSSLENNLICLDDLYSKKEDEIVDIFARNFISWKQFNEADKLINTNEKPNNFYICLETKKRNVIPLLKTNCGNKRITDVSLFASSIYSLLDSYKDTKYAYVNSIIKVK